MKPQLKGNWYKWLFVALRIFWCLKEKNRPAVVKLWVFCSPNLPGQKHHRHAVVYHVLLDWDPVQLLNTLAPCDSFNSFIIFFTFFYLYFFYFLNFYIYLLRFKVTFLTLNLNHPCQLHQVQSIHVFVLVYHWKGDSCFFATKRNVWTHKKRQGIRLN